DIAPLRQLTPEVTASNAHLFAPSPAIRWPRDTNTDTPLPPEEPAGKNPPDGAILYYYLKSAGAVTLEIVDGSGKTVRTYASNDKAPAIPAALNVPTYWIKPFHAVAGTPGMHRLVWDIRGTPPAPSARTEPSMGAIYMDTPLTEGEWLPAGNYTVKLTAGGQSQTQSLVVRPD